jgi:hypothetical protein
MKWNQTSDTSARVEPIVEKAGKPRNMGTRKEVANGKIDNEFGGFILFICSPPSTMVVYNQKKNKKGGEAGRRLGSRNSYSVTFVTLLMG